MTLIPIPEMNNRTTFIDFDVGVPKVDSRRDYAILSRSTFIK